MVNSKNDQTKCHLLARLGKETELKAYDNKRKCPHPLLPASNTNRALYQTISRATEAQ